MAKKSVTRDDAVTTRTAEPPSIIAFGLRIVGNVTSAGTIHVEGEVEGDIDCSELTIGPEGRVRGHVRAVLVHIRGEMDGTVHATTVHIASGASVTGEVIHGTLSVEPGARLDGYYWPVAAAEAPAGGAMRRETGRAVARELLLPYRPLPPRRRQLRRPIVSPPRDETSKPLH